jgi:FkbM family methyltransferase
MSAASWFRNLAKHHLMRPHSNRTADITSVANLDESSNGDLHPADGRGFYSQWLRPGGLVFDVGANVGDRSRMFLELGARVVAVEPQPACAQALRRLSHERLVVEQVALGASPGLANLRIASESTISSMADDWIERVQRSGRFRGHEWPETIEVEVATLDSLIERHGQPSFCKIDVEGYEREVVRGLSQPLPLLSFEFAVEYTDGAEAVLASLERLGFDRFNFVPEETFSLVWDTWRDATAIRKHLSSFPRDGWAWGDVYAAA